MFRQRELNDESVDLGVGVQPFDFLKEPFLRHIVLETNKRRAESAFSA